MERMRRRRHSLHENWDSFWCSASRLRKTAAAAVVLDGNVDGEGPSSSSGRRDGGQHSPMGGDAGEGLGHKRGSGATTAGEGSVLVRRLTLVDLILFGIGASIGAGIFVIAGVTAREAGPAVVLSFGLAGLASVVDALCYAELCSRFPAMVGGAYLYTYSTFGELSAFLVFCNLMLDYHIGAASIARSLASYLASLFLQIIPSAAIWLPSWLGTGGMPLFGSQLLSLNLVAPLILAALTAVLCQGLRESTTLNSFMTSLKVGIVVMVILVGCAEVDPSNWVPFAPMGIEAVITATTVVFFAYVGFDAIANTAEEAKNPERDLPWGILVSLGICALLYVAVCLVLTGMVPYAQLDDKAPLASAFASRGLHFFGAIIDVGALVGLTTTLLVGLYVQSRLYLGIGRDGLLPGGFAVVNLEHHTPVRAQLWVGAVAIALSLFFDVKRLSHILSIGFLTSYSVVCACVVMLRVDENYRPQDTSSSSSSSSSSSVLRWMTRHLDGMTRWWEACLAILCFALTVFMAGLGARWGLALWSLPIGTLIALPFLTIIHTRQVFVEARGFGCPWVPSVPLLGIGFNTYLTAHMHFAAWIRLALVSLLAIAFYAAYGQHYARNATLPATPSQQTASYQPAPCFDSLEEQQGM